MTSTPDTLKRIARNIVDGLNLLKAEGRGKNPDSRYIAVLSDQRTVVKKFRKALDEWNSLFPGVSPEHTALICRGLVTPSNNPLPKPVEKLKPGERPTLREATRLIMQGREVFTATDLHEALKKRGWLPNTKNDPIAYLSFALSKYKNDFERVKWGHYKVKGRPSEKSEPPPPKKPPKAPLKPVKKTMPKANDQGLIAGRLRTTFQKNRKFTAREAAKRLKCHPNRLSSLLSELVVQGKLERVGDQRPAIWRFIK